jgi:cellulose synthase/poly-beta-1,6-N-acetylglucosamine synthase-like glycosyltransferase
MVFGLAAVGRSLLHAQAAYTLGLCLTSLAFRRRSANEPPSAHRPRLAVLVVAHDESRVIADCLESLRGQDYPADRFHVFVVADACSDSTATVARRMGATVFERTGPREGKPRAVAHGVERIRESDEYDAIALFDADNVVDAGFLPAVAGRLASGERVVQGFVDAKNPEASRVSAMSAIGFWAIDAIEQRPRERWRLSARIMGTGFAARSELFPHMLTTPGALADDLEANARLALANVRVAYEPQARTLDERATRLEAAVAQRTRWMQGRWAVAERWVPSLIAAAFTPARERGFAERVRALDVAWQLVTPSLLFSSVALGSLASGELLLRQLTGVGSASPAKRALTLAAVYFFAAVPAVARQRPSWHVWSAYLTQPSFLLRSVQIAIRAWSQRADSTWVPTSHGEEDDARA